MRRGMGGQIRRLGESIGKRRRGRKGKDEEKEEVFKVERRGRDMGGR